MTASGTTKSARAANKPVAAKTVTVVRKTATKAVAKKAASKPVVTKATPKVAAKVVPKTAAPKTAPKATAKPVTVLSKPAVVPQAKPAKVKKPKMIRDSFTMPKAEFAVIDALKNRAANLKKTAKKTELIRAGIKALAAMSDAAFTAAIAAVPNLKTGRPSKS